VTDTRKPDGRGGFVQDAGHLHLPAGTDTPTVTGTRQHLPTNTSATSTATVQPARQDADQYRIPGGSNRHAPTGHAN